MHSLKFLAALLLALASVEAAPSKRGSTVVSLPLRAIHDIRDSEIHPHILAGQHINRGLRRLARMAGTPEPSQLELRANLQKRVDHVHQGFDAGLHSHSKRYVVVDKNTDVSRLNVKTFQAIAGSSDVKLNNAAAATAGAAGAASGVDPIDIQAAQQGGLTNAVAPTASQTLGLDIEANDVGYISVVQIGTPPRDFKTLMDSGSADFWVGGEDCRSSGGGGCGTHTFLGTQSSSSFKDTQKPFNVTYGTGQVAGTIITDDLAMAGFNLKAHTFGVASVESVEFSANDTSFDGLIGLAQSGLSQQRTLTPVESLAQQGLIKEAITSFKISRLSDQKNDGEVSFGGVNSNKFDTNSVVTVPNVNPQGFWEAPMIPTVNNASVGLDTGRTAILDTGTTLIIAPPNDAVAIHKAITGAKVAQDQQTFLVPCTMTDVITMSFGGQAFPINPKDVAFLPADNNNPTGDCISGIQAGQIGGATEWLVGDVFLKNAYFSTNTNQNTVSLAKLK